MSVVITSLLPEYATAVDIHLSVIHDVSCNICVTLISNSTKTATEDIAA